MRLIRSFPLVACLLATSVGAAHAQVVDKKALTLEGARKVIAAALAEAKRLDAPGAAVAVVDEGGNLIALERLDDTIPAAPGIAIGKARTAALFKRPTKAYEDSIATGRTALVALADAFTPLQGGVPLVYRGQVLGAVGVSGGATAPQDEDIALAGVKTLEAAGSAAAR